MFVVDTNILLYAVDRDSPEHAVCRAYLQKWRRRPDPWHLTWGIIYEFLRVATHPNVFRKPLSLDQAWSFIEAILAAPGVSVLEATENHARIAAEVFEEVPGIRGNLVFDAHTAVLMREHGIRTIYTRDADFSRFPFIEVVDPLQQHRRSGARRHRPRSGHRP